MPFFLCSFGQELVVRSVMGALGYLACGTEDGNERDLLSKSTDRVVETDVNASLRPNMSCLGWNKRQ